MTPISEGPVSPPSDNDLEVEAALSKLAATHTWKKQNSVGVASTGKYIYSWRCDVCWDTQITDEPPMGGCKGPPEPYKGYINLAPGQLIFNVPPGHKNYTTILSQTINTTSTLAGWEEEYKKAGQEMAELMKRQYQYAIKYWTDTTTP